MVWPHHMWALKNPTLRRTRLSPDYRRPGVSDFPSLRNPEYDIALFEAIPDSRPTSSIPAGYRRAVYGTDHLHSSCEARCNTTIHRHLRSLFAGISLGGNPKESVKHKSNNNGCVWCDGIVIVVVSGNRHSRQ